MVALVLPGKLYHAYDSFLNWVASLAPPPTPLLKGDEITAKIMFFSLFFFLSLCSNSNRCPSVALMFQIGQSATYHDVSSQISVALFSCVFAFFRQSTACRSKFSLPSSLRMISVINRWAGVRKEQILAPARHVKAMKLT